MYPTFNFRGDSGLQITFGQAVFPAEFSCQHCIQQTREVAVPLAIDPEAAADAVVAGNTQPVKEVRVEARSQSKMSYFIVLDVKID